MRNCSRVVHTNILVSTFECPAVLTASRSSETIMDKRLRAELWETQIWLMWLLASLLYQFGHAVIADFVLAWSALTLVGIFLLFIGAKIEEKSETPTRSPSN